MDYMGFEYDPENEEEQPVFKYSYFHIVQTLLLWNTSHSGGTSTQVKCRQLGFDSSESVVLRSEEDILNE